MGEEDLPGEVTFASVWFDCDSTLSAIEGIDELALGIDPEARARLAGWTARAMAGEIPLADVYRARLELVSPTRSHVEDLGNLYVQRLVPDAREVVAALCHLGKHVGIVSGGLEPAVRILGAELGVPAERIRAVPIHFDSRGRYAAFDRECPLARNGGKGEILAALPPSERPLCFVGDGVTDLEAAPVVELFVGYGGVVRREAVARAARHYLTAPSLLPLLALVLTAAERQALARKPRFATMLQRGGTHPRGGAGQP
jgi:phosphoserine phosphatase